MVQLFDVTTPDNTVLLSEPVDEDGKARRSAALFTVTYVGGTPIWATAQAVAEDPQAQPWLSLKQAARRYYQPGDTVVYTAMVRVPEDATAGLYRFALGIGEEDNTDENHTFSPQVAFAVPHDSRAGGSRWLWLLLALVAVVVVGLIVLLTRPAPPVATARAMETRLSPAVATDGRNIYVVYRRHDLRLYLATFDTLTRQWTSTDSPIQFDLADEEYNAITFASPSLLWHDDALYLAFQTDNGVSAAYVVREGDTLASIASVTGRRQSALMQANNLTNDVNLREGVVLELPRVPQPQANRYIVQPRDTLESIAYRVGRSQVELMQANNLTNPNLLYTGLELRLPAAPTPLQEGYRVLRYTPQTEHWDDFGHVGASDANPRPPALGFIGNRFVINYGAITQSQVTPSNLPEGTAILSASSAWAFANTTRPVQSPITIVRQNRNYVAVRASTSVVAANPLNTVILLEDGCSPCSSLSVTANSMDASATRFDEPGFAAAPLVDDWLMFVMREQVADNSNLLMLQVPPDVSGVVSVPYEVIPVAGGEDGQSLMSQTTPALARVLNQLYLFVVQNDEIRLATRTAERQGEWSMPESIVLELAPTALPPTPTMTPAPSPTFTSTPAPTATPTA